MFVKLKNSSLALRVIGVLLLSAVMLAVFIPPSHALRVSLKRIIFEGRERSQVITVINNSADDETYRLGWRNFRMTENVMLENVPEGEEADLKIAEPLLRYAPRRFTVKAGETQQIRIITRFPRDLEDGEYRSHLYILPEAKPPEFTVEEMKAAKTKPVVKIGLLAGLSVPIFVRRGNLSATASFTDAKASRKEDKVHITTTLHREGDRSLFGDIDFICTSGGEEKVIFQKLGVAVYPEVNKRFMDMSIPYPEEGCSEVRMDYIAEFNDSQYQGGVMASANVSIQ